MIGGVVIIVFGDCWLLVVVGGFVGHGGGGG